MLGHADDNSMWRDEGEKVTHVVTGLALTRQTVKGDVIRLTSLNHDSVLDQPFALARGPAELPSMYLARMRRDGWVCLPSLVFSSSRSASRVIAGLLLS